MKRICLVTAVSLGLIGCETTTQGTSASVTRQIPVDANFSTGVQSWGAKPSYRYRWAVRNFNGKLEVCGVGVFLDLQRRSGSEDAMAARQVVDAQGNTILSDLSFFSRVKRRSELDTAKANCKASELAARSSGTYSIRGFLRGGRSF